MYGERVVITDVAAFMITIGFFASAEMGATASAFGVSPKPARMSTLSRVRSSCAWRLAMSRRRSGRIPDDDARPSPAVDVAVQLEVRLHPADDLLPVVGERSREFGDDADAHGFLCDRVVRSRRRSASSARRRSLASTHAALRRSLESAAAAAAASEL
jgi:hypothetical protein